MIFFKVMEGLKVGNEALKAVNGILSVEEIEKIMDETKEGVEKQKVCLKSVGAFVFNFWIKHVLKFLFACLGIG